jgi:threonine aldolase
VRRWALAVLLAGAACGRAADSERRGDEAYGRGRYTEALQQYLSQAGEKADPRFWAKTGTAASPAAAPRG